MQPMHPHDPRRRVIPAIARPSRIVIPGLREAQNPESVSMHSTPIPGSVADEAGDGPGMTKQ